MKTTLIFWVFLIVALAVTSSCSKDEAAKQTEPVKINLPLKSAEVIAQGNEFGIDLFRLVAAGENKNLMLSPLSASTALTMLMNGSAGNTFSQISSMLGDSNLTQPEINAVYQSLISQLLVADPDVNLMIANSVWYRQTFEVKVPFLSTMTSSFDAHTEALDFNSVQALNTINNWASENTNGKIPKVLDQISPDAVMFLMNALYFKGTWTTSFEKNKTSPSIFYTNNGQTISVDMMHGEFAYKTYSEVDFSVAELPYGRQNFVMDIILPVADLTEFLPTLDAAKWNRITAGLGAVSQPSKAEIGLPKFSFSYEKILNDQLKVLGMTDAFDASLADLSPISDADIFVSFVKQNTFVNVNEEGTEAAAVTTVGIELTSMPQSFIVDRPFVFVIREQTTNTLLFIGQVVNPIDSK